MYQLKKKSQDDLKFKAEEFGGKIGGECFESSQPGQHQRGLQGKQCAQGRGSFHLNKKDVHYTYLKISLLPAVIPYAQSQ